MLPSTSRRSRSIEERVEESNIRGAERITLRTETKATRRTEDDEKDDDRALPFRTSRYWISKHELDNIRQDQVAIENDRGKVINKRPMDLLLPPKLKRFQRMKQNVLPRSSRFNNPEQRSSSLFHAPVLPQYLPSHHQHGPSPRIMAYHKKKKKKGKDSSRTVVNNTQVPHLADEIIGAEKDPDFLTRVIHHLNQKQHINHVGQNLIIDHADPIQLQYQMLEEQDVKTIEDAILYFVERKHRNHLLHFKHPLRKSTDPHRPYDLQKVSPPGHVIRDQDSIYIMSAHSIMESSIDEPTECIPIEEWIFQSRMLKEISSGLSIFHNFSRRKFLFFWKIYVQQKIFRETKQRLAAKLLLSRPNLVGSLLQICEISADIQEKHPFTTKVSPSTQQNSSFDSPKQPAKSTSSNLNATPHVSLIDLFRFQEVNIQILENQLHDYNNLVKHILQTTFDQIQEWATQGTPLIAEETFAHELRTFHQIHPKEFKSTPISVLREKKEALLHQKAQAQHDHHLFSHFAQLIRYIIDASLYKMMYQTLSRFQHELSSSQQNQSIYPLQLGLTISLENPQQLDLDPSASETEEKLIDLVEHFIDRIDTISASIFMDLFHQQEQFGISQSTLQSPTASIDLLPLSIEFPSRKTICGIVKQDLAIQSMICALLSCFETCFSVALNVSNSFEMLLPIYHAIYHAPASIESLSEQFGHLLNFDKRGGSRDNVPPDSKEISCVLSYGELHLNELQQWITGCQKLQPSHHVGFLEIQCRQIIQKLLHAIDDHRYNHFQFFDQVLQQLITQHVHELKSAIAIFDERPQTIESFCTQAAHVQELQSREKQLKLNERHVEDLLQLLKHHGFGIFCNPSTNSVSSQNGSDVSDSDSNPKYSISSDTLVRYNGLHTFISKYFLSYQLYSKFGLKMVPSINEKLIHEIQKSATRVTYLGEELTDDFYFTSDGEPQERRDQLSEIEDELIELQLELEHYQRYQEIMQVNVIKIPTSVNETQLKLEEVQAFWTLAQEHKDLRIKVESSPFRKLNWVEIQNEYTQLEQAMKRDDSEGNQISLECLESEMGEKMIEDVHSLLDDMPLLLALGNEALKDRHWRQIIQLLDIQATSMSESMTENDSAAKAAAVLALSTRGSNIQPNSNFNEEDDEDDEDEDTEDDGDDGEDMEEMEEMDMNVKEKLLQELLQTLTLRSLQESQFWQYTTNLYDIVTQAHEEQEIEKQAAAIQLRWKEKYCPFTTCGDSYEISAASLSHLLNELDQDLIQFHQYQNKMIHFDEMYSVLRKWTEEMDDIQEKIEMWMECQQCHEKLMHILPLLSKQSHQKKLQVDFDTIHRQWKQLLRGIGSSETAVVELLQERMANHSFTEMLGHFEHLLHLFSVYCLEKRESFGRFHFLSDVDLLEFLVSAVNPEQASSKISKCFPHCASMTLSEEVSPEITENSEYSSMTKNMQERMINITGIIGQYGEIISFGKNKTDFIPFDSATPEQWMKKVESSIKKQMKHLFDEHYPDYETCFLTPPAMFEISKGEFRPQIPCQLLLLMQSIYWTWRITQCFQEKKLPQHPSQQKSSWEALTHSIEALHKAFIQGLYKNNSSEMPPNRWIYLQMIGILMHWKERIESLRQVKLEDGNTFRLPFEWIQHLRPYWDSKTQVCSIVHSAGIQTYDYAFHYLGISSSPFVHSPLTDRVFLNFSMALRLSSGALCYGGSSTGKRRTIIEFASQLGQECFEFDIIKHCRWNQFEQFCIGMFRSRLWLLVSGFSSISSPAMFACISHQLTKLRQQLLVLSTTSSSHAWQSSNSSVQSSNKLTSALNSIDFTQNSTNALLPIFLQERQVSISKNKKNSFSSLTSDCFLPVAFQSPDFAIFLEFYLRLYQFSARNISLCCQYIQSFYLDYVRTDHEFQRSIPFTLTTIQRLTKESGDIRFKKVFSSQSNEESKTIAYAIWKIHSAQLISNEQKKRFQLYLNRVFSHMEHLDYKLADQFLHGKELIKYWTKELNLQALPHLNHEIQNLYRLSQRTLMIVIVGQVMTGKSTLVQLFSKVYGSLMTEDASHPSSKPIKCFPFNIQAFDGLADFYGSIASEGDGQQQQWSPGLVSYFISQHQPSKHLNSTEKKDVPWFLFDEDQLDSSISLMEPLLALAKEPLSNNNRNLQRPDILNHLCLPNGQKLDLGSPEDSTRIRLFFETCSLRHLSPHLISKVGILSLPPNHLPYTLFIKAWMTSIQSKRPWKFSLVQACGQLMRRYLPYFFDLLRESRSTDDNNIGIAMLPHSSSIVIQLISVCNALIDTFHPATSNSTFVLAYALTWSIGMNFTTAGSRKKFHDHLLDIFPDLRSSFDTTANQSSSITIYDVALRFENGNAQFESWKTTKAALAQHQQAWLFESLKDSWMNLHLPNELTISAEYMCQFFIHYQLNVLVCGQNGQGKTSILRNCLSKLASNNGGWTGVQIAFNELTRPKEVRQFIVGASERRMKGLHGPSSGHKFGYFFIDDLQLASSGCHEMIRQVIDHRIMFSKTMKRKTSLTTSNAATEGASGHFELMELQNFIYAGAANSSNILSPSKYSSTFSIRFLRHFYILWKMEETFDQLNDMFVNISNDFMDMMLTTKGLTFNRTFFDAVFSFYSHLYIQLREWFSSSNPHTPSYRFTLNDLCTLYFNLCFMPNLEDTFQNLEELQHVLVSQACFRLQSRLTTADDRAYFDACFQRAFRVTLWDEWKTIKRRKKSVITQVHHRRRTRRRSSINIQESIMMVANLASNNDKETDPSCDTSIQAPDIIPHISTTAQSSRETLNLFRFGVDHWKKQHHTHDDQEFLAPLPALVVNFNHVRRIFQSKLTAQKHVIHVGRRGRGKCTTAELVAYSLGFDFHDLNLFHDWNSVVEAISSTPSAKSTVFHVSLFWLWSKSQVQLFIQTIQETILSSNSSTFQHDEDNDTAQEVYIDSDLNHTHHHIHWSLAVESMAELKQITDIFPECLNYFHIESYFPWTTEMYQMLTQKKLPLKKEKKQEKVKEQHRMSQILIEIAQDQQSSVFSSSHTGFQDFYTNVQFRYKHYDQHYTQLERRLRKSLEILKLNLMWYHKQQQAHVSEEKRVLEIEQQKRLIAKERLAYEMSLGEDQHTSDLDKQFLECQSEMEDKLKGFSNKLLLVQQTIMNLNRKHLDELRRYANPPELVKLVMGAVCLLFKVAPTWAEAQKLLADVHFINRLLNFQWDHLTVKDLEVLRKQYLSHAEFNHQGTKHASDVIAHLCLWVLAVDQFVQVKSDTKPLQMNLERIEYQMQQNNKKKSTKLDRLKQLEHHQQFLLRNQTAFHQAQNQMEKQHLTSHEKQQQQQSNCDFSNSDSNHEDESASSTKDTDQDTTVSETKWKTIQDLMKWAHIEQQWIESKLEKVEQKRRFCVGACIILGSVKSYFGPLTWDERCTLFQRWKNQLEGSEVLCPSSLEKCVKFWFSKVERQEFEIVNGDTLMSKDINLWINVWLVKQSTQSILEPRQLKKKLMKFPFIVDVQGFGWQWLKYWYHHRHRNHHHSLSRNENNSDDVVVLFASQDRDSLLQSVLIAFQSQHHVILRNVELVIHQEIIQLILAQYFMIYDVEARVEDEGISTTTTTGKEEMHQRMRSMIYFISSSNDTDSASSLSPSNSSSDKEMMQQYPYLEAIHFESTYVGMEHQLMNLAIEELNPTLGQSITDWNESNNKSSRQKQELWTHMMHTLQDEFKSASNESENLTIYHQPEEVQTKWKLQLEKYEQILKEKQETPSPPYLSSRPYISFQYLAKCGILLYYLIVSMLFPTLTKLPNQSRSSSIIKTRRDSFYLFFQRMFHKTLEQSQWKYRIFSLYSSSIHSRSSPSDPCSANAFGWQWFILKFICQIGREFSKAFTTTILFLWIGTMKSIPTKSSFLSQNPNVVIKNWQRSIHTVVGRSNRRIPLPPVSILTHIATQVVQKAVSMFQLKYIRPTQETPPLAFVLGDLKSTIFHDFTKIVSFQKYQREWKVYFNDPKVPCSSVVNFPPCFTGFSSWEKILVQIYHYQLHNQNHEQHQKSSHHFLKLVPELIKSPFDLPGKSLLHLPSDSISFFSSFSSLLAHPSPIMVSLPSSPALSFTIPIQLPLLSISQFAEEHNAKVHTMSCLESNELLLEQIRQMISGAATPISNCNTFITNHSTTASTTEIREWYVFYDLNFVSPAVLHALKEALEFFCAASSSVKKSNLHLWLLVDHISRPFFSQYQWQCQHIRYSADHDHILPLSRNSRSPAIHHQNNIHPNSHVQEILMVFHSYQLENQLSDSAELSGWQEKYDYHAFDLMRGSQILNWIFPAANAEHVGDDYDDQYSTKSSSALLMPQDMACFQKCITALYGGKMKHTRDLLLLEHILHKIITRIHPQEISEEPQTKQKCHDNHISSSSAHAMSCFSSFQCHDYEQMVQCHDDYQFILGLETFSRSSPSALMSRKSSSHLEWKYIIPSRSCFEPLHELRQSLKLRQLCVAISSIHALFLTEVRTLESYLDYIWSFLIPTNLNMQTNIIPPQWAHPLYHSCSQEGTLIHFDIWLKWLCRSISFLQYWGKLLQRTLGRSSTTTSSSETNSLFQLPWIWLPAFSNPGALWMELKYGFALKHKLSLAEIEFHMMGHDAIITEEDLPFVIYIHDVFIRVRFIS